MLVPMRFREGELSVAGIDVEPDAVLLEDVSEGVQMVDTHPSRVTNIRCTSEYTVPLGLLFADDSLKRVLVHAEVLVDGHTDNVVLAQREPRHSSADQIVLDDFGYQNADRAGGPLRPDPGKSLSRAATSAIVLDKQPPRIRIPPISLAIE